MSRVRACGVGRILRNSGRQVLSAVSISVLASVLGQATAQTAAPDLTCQPSGVGGNYVLQGEPSLDWQSECNGYEYVSPPPRGMPLPRSCVSFEVKGAGLTVSESNYSSSRVEYPERNNSGNFIERTFEVDRQTGFYSASRTHTLSGSGFSMGYSYGTCTKTNPTQPKPNLF